jgi:glycosyltransferase involved in cell wall biosynthesis
MTYNAFTKFTAFGGAELIAIYITKGLAEKGESISLLSCTCRNKFNARYKVENLTVKQFSFLFFLKISNKSVIISHHRKLTTLLIIVRALLFKRFRIIHVAHNEFHTLKYFTLFPKQIIAVSEKVKQNLTNYFNIESNRINVIYNGIPDRNPESSIYCRKHDGVIRILVPARITAVKSQCRIVQELKGNLHENIEIHFAGTGDDLDKLKELVKNEPQFKVLGFQSFDLIINDYDYVMLFSTMEGLPTVFLESFMYGKPVISNNAGGSLEILDDNNNGFYAADFESLIATVNSLPTNNSEKYRQLCINARKKYKACYTIDKMIESYYKLLKNEI